MKTKNYSSLLLAFCISLSVGALQVKPDNQKATVLEKMHWLIERSDMQQVIAGFEQICQENDFPSLVVGLKDGTYKGATPRDNYGYSHEVSFEIKSGKMVAIDYDEIHQDGKAKQSDKEYGTRMLENGTTPAIAYPKYESQMIARQDFNKVDAVSGASYSLYRFKLAILYAMLNAGQL